MDKVLSRGGRVAFELPAENELWNDEQFKKFEEAHGMARAYSMNALSTCVVVRGV